MKIQYCSDLHLEFKDNSIFLFANRLHPKADILILAGDILPFAKNIEKEPFFDFLSETFKEVYWLPGNHEYYYSDIIRFHKFKETPIRHNIHVIKNQVISINDVNIIFSTLWSHISPKNELYIQTRLNDFACIDYDGEIFVPKQYNQLHQEAIQFLETELKNRIEEKNVVITHHVPTLINYNEEYKKSAINEAFAVEMEELIDKYQPEAWIYGHSHINTPEFSIGKTKILTNQLGYVAKREHLSFRLDAFIDII